MKSRVKIISRVIRRVIEVMEQGQTGNLYLMLMYVYLRAYQEAIQDFEDSMKDTGYGDMALMSVKQRHRENIDKIARELML